MVTISDGRTVANPEKVEDAQHRIIEALSQHLSSYKRVHLKVVFRPLINSDLQLWQTLLTVFQVLSKILVIVEELRSCRTQETKSLDWFGKRSNGQYHSPMGVHMAPVIHTLLCEKPPMCRECGIEPCALHQHYHPNRLPPFKGPPPCSRAFPGGRGAGVSSS